MIVHKFLSDSAQATPDAIALIEPTRSISYGALDRFANRLARLFQICGLQRGDRVVIASDNCLEFVGAYFGALRAGGVAVPLPGGPRNDRLAKAIVDCNPAICVVDLSTASDASLQPLLSTRTVFVLTPQRATGLSVPLTGTALEEALTGICDEPVTVRTIDLDLAAIIYTSGSTGEPRGVMLTHRNIVANTRSIVEYLHLTAQDKVMSVLPFSYVYGLSLVHTHVAVGGSVVIDTRFAYPNVIMRSMQHNAVTGFAGVPSTFAVLLDRVDLAQLNWPALRYVTQAGGGMPPARIEEWRRRVPNVDFYVMYGATEAAARLTYLEPGALERKLGSIGQPIPNVDIRVIKEDGTPAKPGEVGELLAQGANISCGYWNDAQETNAKFGPMGYRTGDLGYVDDDGYLFLVGRKDDMIKTGAHRIGPKEIEDVLCQHPHVRETAVIGAPHVILGEAPVAFVVLTPGAGQDSDVLRAFCHQQLAPFKVPVRFYFVEQLPRLAGSGKLDRVTLRATLAQNVGSGLG